MYEAKLAKCVIKRPTRPRQDKVEDNIKNMSFWNRICDQERKSKSQVFKRRRENALKKKEQLFMDKIRLNIYYMNRWDIVREKRKDIEKAQRHQERRELFKFWYIRQQKTVAALKVVYDIFDQTRTAIMNEYKEKLLAKRIIRRFGQYVEKKAPTVENRLINNVRMSISASIPYMEDICQQRSKFVVKDFIKVASMNYDIKTSFIKYHDSVCRVQHAWSRVRSDYQLRAVILSRMWDKEADAMILY